MLEVAARLIKPTNEMCLANLTTARLYCFTGGVYRRDKGWDAAFYETHCYGNYRQKTQKVGALTCSVLFYTIFVIWANRLLHMRR